MFHCLPLTFITPPDVIQKYSLKSSSTNSLIGMAFEFRFFKNLVNKFVIVFSLFHSPKCLNDKHGT